MRRPAKRRNDLAARIFGFVVVLAGSLLLALQQPKVQTGLAEQLLKRIEDRFNGTISVGHISISPFNSLTLNDVLVIDKDPYTAGGTIAPADTFARIGTLTAKISLKTILRKKVLHLSYVHVTDGYMHLVNMPHGSAYKTNLEHIFPVKHKPRKGYAATPDLFQIDRVELERFRYRMNSFSTSRRKHAEGSINWTDLDVTADFSVRALKYTGGRMSGVMEKGRIHEKCGYTIESLSGRARVGMGKATIEKIHLVDAWSDTRIPLYSMSWNSMKDFRDFVDNIRLTLHIKGGSHLDTRTLGAFAGGLKGLAIGLDLDDVQARGYVSDLCIDSFSFTEPESGIKGNFKGIVTGLTHKGPLLLDANVGKLGFSTAGVSRLMRTLGKKVNMGKLLNSRVYTFRGTAKGTLDNLRTNGSLSSNAGSARFALGLRNLTDRKRDSEIGGTLSLKDLNIGAIAGIDKVGECSANTGFRARLSKSGPSVTFDSLMVDRLQLLGYEYTGIAASGKYDKKAVDARLICGDPNLNFILQGLYSPAQDGGNSLIKVSGSVGYADLQALHLDKRGTSKVSGLLNANIMQIPQGDFVGDIALRDVTLENGRGPRNIGDVEISAHSNGELQRIQLRSDFLDAGFAGTSLAGIFADIQHVTTRREVPALYSLKKPDPVKGDSEYDLSLDFHDSRDLLSFVMPGLYVADSTSVELTLSRSGLLNGHISSPRLAKGANYLKGVDITLDNAGGSINATVLSRVVSAKGLLLENASLSAYAQQDEFFTGLQFDGVRPMDSVGEIYLAGRLVRDGNDSLTIIAKPLSSYLSANGQQWELDESEILLRSGAALVKGFCMHNADQRITLDGSISGNRPDTLRLGISALDMGVVNYFTKKDYDIHGQINGNAQLYSPMGAGMRALLNLNCDSLMVSGTSAGSIKVAGIWNNPDDKVSLFLRNVVDGQDAMNVVGSLMPKAGRLDATARLNGMQLVMAKPFLNGVVDDISGGISGNITVSGPTDSLTISTEGTRIDAARVKVSATGVEYVLDGAFHANNSEIEFDELSILDSRGGSATLDGGVHLSNLKSPRLGARLRMNRLLLLDNRPGARIYGQLAADGSVAVSGPLNAILVAADVATSGSGNLHIPLSGSHSAQNSDLLTFTSHEPEYHDPYEDILAEFITSGNKARAAGSDFMLRGRVTVDPGLGIHVDLDNAGGNRVFASGQGVISVNMRPSRSVMDISGDYTVESGKLNFALPGIVSKDFNLSSGSSIKFGGDLADTQLDLEATYQLRTSLKAIMADTSSVNTRRNVICKVHLGDKISSPSLTLGIDVPDLDPTSKSVIESALNTEDKVQKQFLALLVTGSFLPDEQGGVVNNTNILFSNVGEMVSRQISNMLSRLNIPLDMGLAYQQASGGGDLFDVAISTELFNNRVVVNGSVSNRLRSSSRAGEMVGDIDVEIKLDKEGQLRLNMFSHSADEHTAYLDYSQRNGGGISYQKEFSTWKEFFQGMFRSRAKREELRRQARESERRQPMRTIKAEPRKESKNGK